MDLRWRTVVVTYAGSTAGREVAARFARAGAGVVAVDGDAAAAAEVAAAARVLRVQAWAVQADVGREDDVQLLGHRLRDLGGADVLVDLGGPAPRLARLVADGLPHRRGRTDEPAQVVHVGAPDVDDTATPPVPGVRRMQVAPDDDPARLAAAVLSAVRRRP